MHARPVKKIFHLLPNAHLDPVWLWDWREGLNEGLITVRTVLNLMDEFPDLTFIRGEAAIYRHIQQSDRRTFDRILKKIDEGRWDVVGGSVIQPDTNLTGTEVLCREWEMGLDYFEKNLNSRPTVAWLADSFGHSAGLPNIFSAFGMDGFAFTRPQRSEFPLESPAFWWEGGWKNRILCYRQYWKWYCSERENTREILDATLAGSEKHQFSNHGVLFGLGNHGGGPTRRHLLDIEAWRAEHPEVEVRFSTLHGFFKELRKEVAKKSPTLTPVVKGEFGFCLRGCYSSVQKFKGLFRQGEALIAEAEVTRSIIKSSLRQAEIPSLNPAWEALAFNAFHDILPGSSIERAFEEQTAWMGGALHEAQTVKFIALNKLAEMVNTTVPPPPHPDRATDVPILVWNPAPQAFTGQVELEASLDYRLLWDYRNRVSELPVVIHDHNDRLMPSQVIQTEHTSMQDVPWRVRVVVPLEIPAWGWTVVRLGWRDRRPAQVRNRIRVNRDSMIEGGDWKVVAQKDCVQVFKAGLSLFGKGGIQLKVVEDLYGSWGGMIEEEDSYKLPKVIERWKLVKSAILEAGPLRGKLWTRWQGIRSWVDLTFSVGVDLPCLMVSGRLLWNERSSRLKLILPCKGQLEYDVPGGTVSREVEGQVPGGRWVVRKQGNAKLGFASDVLGDFDATAEELRVTLARATRYANDSKTKADEKMWQPATDCGELKFRFSVFTGETRPEEAVAALLFAPTALVAPGRKGSMPRQGSLGGISPATVRLLSLEETGRGVLRLRLQNIGARVVQPVFLYGKKRISLLKLQSQQIKTFTLKV